MKGYVLQLLSRGYGEISQRVICNQLMKNAVPAVPAVPAISILFLFIIYTPFISIIRYFEWLIILI
jgi:hypothetical protein